MLNAGNCARFGLCEVALGAGVRPFNLINLSETAVDGEPGAFKSELRSGVIFVIRVTK